jgi:hypothetical protein
MNTEDNIFLTNQVTRPHMIVQRFSSFEEQERANRRYWNSKTIDDKLQATLDLIEYTLLLKGKDVHPTRSDRSITRLKRASR